MVPSLFHCHHGLPEIEKCLLLVSGFRSLVEHLVHSGFSVNTSRDGQTGRLVKRNHKGKMGLPADFSGVPAPTSQRRKPTEMAQLSPPETLLPPPTPFGGSQAARNVTTHEYRTQKGPLFCGDVSGGRDPLGD